MKGRSNKIRSLQVGRKDKDLLLVCVLILLSILSFFFLKEDNPIRIIFGFLLVFFLPGYALTSLLRETDLIERIAFSFGVSIVISPLVGFVFNFTPWGITSIYVIITLTVVTLSFIPFAYRQRRLEEKHAKPELGVVKARLKPYNIDKKLILVSILSWVLLPIIAFYFKFFPTIGSPLISDLFIVGLIFSLFLLLTIGSFLIKNPTDVFYLLPQCLIFTFLARIIRYLRIPYPALWDPYTHLISFLNIHEYHTLNPIMDWWLPNIEGSLHWPLMYLITEELIITTGINYIHLWRFQEPLLGMVFFLAIFTLAREVTGNNRTALLAGYFTSFASHIIFYQSEYHPQGLALIIFAFLIYSFIKSESTNRMLYRLLTLLFVFACVFSHYFSSLFLAVVFATLIVMQFLSKKLPIGIRGESTSSSIFLVIVIFSLAYHLYVYSKHFETYVKMILSITHPYNAALFGSSDVFFVTTIIKSVRWIVFALAVMSVTYILKTKDKKEYYLATFWLIFLILGFVGEYLIWLEVGRIILFYEVITGTFAALTLSRFRDIWVGRINRSKKTFMVCLLTSLILTCTFFGGHYMPTYYFKSFGMNNHYWCSNRLPNMDAYVPAGKWLNVFTPSDAKFVTDFDRYGFTSSMVLLFGEKSSKNIIKTNSPIKGGLKLFKHLKREEYVYVVLNQAYKYSNLKDFLRHSNLIYTNGEIGIYTR